MADITETERKQIECWTALRAYLNKVFADEKLEKRLFDSRQDIVLLKVEGVEIDTKGAKATAVYGINGVGAYRRLEDVNLFHNQFYYRWGHHNSPFALAYALAADTKNMLKPEQLEAKLSHYIEQANSSR